MAGIMSQIILCEELAKLSDQINETVRKADQMRLPTSYIVGCMAEHNSKLKKLIHQFSGGLYEEPLKTNNHDRKSIQPVHLANNSHSGQ